jgi:hypothetical protein
LGFGLIFNEERSNSYEKDIQLIQDIQKDPSRKRKILVRIKYIA